ncbi:MAG: Unknown protein [uncultured Sulfurovum sp.]|uniref:Uncharacterized protein n=1 Tax=uncultured Sulfurovum sp. TaxID=269237 RepID=A0A6S6T4U3_9BACT|nr:MAG: Unknown protein [uncultured Sulfurovum sp.]
MADCIIDSGYNLDCASIGGLESVWIGSYSGSTSYAYDVDNVVTGATGANDVYKMEMDIEYGGLEQTGGFSRENGTVFYESKLSVKFIELDKDLRNLIIKLGRAPIYAVVKSNAGHTYILGVESAGRATEGTASLGVAQGDMNGATLTFTWKSQNGAYLMDESVLGTDITVA